MARVDRRSFLKLSGGGAVAATTGGIAGILATGRAPAYAQASTIHWLRWTDFVPASDQLLRNELAKEGEKALGAKLNIETINANNIQARITSASSRSRPDIVFVLNNCGQLLARALVDVSDIAEEIGKAQGAFRVPREPSPMTGRNGSQCRRASFQPAGRCPQVMVRGYWLRGWKISQPGQIREAGRKLKADGRPLRARRWVTRSAITAFTLPSVWCWGKPRMKADGKTVVLNSPATVSQ